MHINILPDDYKNLRHDQIIDELFFDKFTSSNLQSVINLITGYVNTILSWPGIIPLSRLTYTAYLVHPIVLSYYNYSMQETIVFNNIVYVSKFSVFTSNSQNSVGFIFSSSKIIAAIKTERRNSTGGWVSSDGDLSRLVFSSKKVLDFWCRLPWVSKTKVDPLIAYFVTCKQWISLVLHITNLLMDNVAVESF